MHKDIKCPNCEEPMGLEAENLDVDELIDCAECGEEYEVVSLDPLKLRAMGEEDEEEVEEEEEY